jgi:hypothetical protein
MTTGYVSDRKIGIPIVQQEAADPTALHGCPTVRPGVRGPKTMGEALTNAFLAAIQRIAAHQSSQHSPDN